VNSRPTFKTPRVLDLSKPASEIAQQDYARALPPQGAAEEEACHISRTVTRMRNRGEQTWATAVWTCAVRGGRVRGVHMFLNPRALRELHWQAIAAE
jgi:hypothetical protein